MWRRVLLCLLCLLPPVAVPRGALGDEASQRQAQPPAVQPGQKQPGQEKEKKPQPDDAALNHRFQVGLSVRGGTGFRVIAPYEDSQDCDAEGNRVCGGRQPAWIEISPSFGVSHSLEVLVDARIYLEEDPVIESRAFFFAPGLKYYASPDDMLKFMISGHAVLEYQAIEAANLERAGLHSFDFKIRAVLGLQVDLNRHVGLLVQGGVIMGVVRWLTFTIDFAGGVQVRY